MKIITCFFLTAFIGLNLVSCKDNSVQSKEDVISYKSIVFIVPGELDNSVDLLSQGGVLKIDIIGEDSLNGYLKIPPNSGTIYNKIDTNFSGNFIQKSDTINFINTGTFLDNSSLSFIIHSDTLKTFADISQRGYHRIVLIKQ